MIRYKDVEVKILGASDYREIAWKLSRPNSEASLKDTEVTDFGLHDLKTVTFQFGTSAGFRELLTILRPYSMWSQSSRATKIQDIPIVSYMSGSEAIISDFERCIDETGRTHQDVGRNYLPLAHYSEYVYQCSIRTIIGVVKSLNAINQFYYDIYGRPILKELGLSEDQMLSMPFPPIHSHYINPSSWNTGKSSFNGIHTIGLLIKLAHRAQLVRQSQIKVVDSMWDMASYGQAIDRSLLGDMVKATIVANDGQIKRLARFRSCLLFDTEAWWPLLKDHWNNTLSLDIFPCNGHRSGCILPYEARDAELGKFSTTSCPIWDKNPKSLQSRLDYMSLQEIKDILQRVVSQIF